MEKLLLFPERLFRPPHTTMYIISTVVSFARGLEMLNSVIPLE